MQWVVDYVTQLRNQVQAGQPQNIQHNLPPQPDHQPPPQAERLHTPPPPPLEDPDREGRPLRDRVRRERGPQPAGSAGNVARYRLANVHPDVKYKEQGYHPVGTYEPDGDPANARTVVQGFNVRGQPFRMLLWFTPGGQAIPRDNTRLAVGGGSIGHNHLRLFTEYVGYSTEDLSKEVFRQLSVRRGVLQRFNWRDYWTMKHRAFLRSVAEDRSQMISRADYLIPTFVGEGPIADGHRASFRTHMLNGAEELVRRVRATPLVPGDLQDLYQYGLEAHALLGQLLDEHLFYWSTYNLKDERGRIHRERLRGGEPYTLLSNNLQRGPQPPLPHHGQQPPPHQQPFQPPQPYQP